MKALGARSTSAPLIGFCLPIFGPVPQPSPEHFPLIVSSMLEDMAKELGVSTTELPPLHPEAQHYLQRHFARGASMQQVCAAISRALAITPVQEHKVPVHLNLQTALDASLVQLVEPVFQGILEPPDITGICVNSWPTLGRKGRPRNLQRTRTNRSANLT